MPRSASKGPVTEEYLIKKVKLLQQSDEPQRHNIKVWCRRHTIIPSFVGITFDVHNGHKFIPVSVTKEMIGRKLGEFSPTRTFRGYGNKKTKG
jgi:small subunit ribosomal protein S19